MRGTGLNVFCLMVTMVCVVVDAVILCVLGIGGKGAMVIDWS